MDSLRWKLDRDKKTATLILPTDPPVALRLNAAQIDTMIRDLGIFRATMQPHHPREWLPAQKIVMEPYPRWSVQPDPLLGDTLLHLRDPRFGWLHYDFPLKAAHELGQCLIAQANTPPPSQANLE